MSEEFVGVVETGRLLLASGDHDSAIEAAQEAVAIEPRCCIGYLLGAAAFHARGAFVAADRWYGYALGSAGVPSPEAVVSSREAVRSLAERDGGFAAVKEEAAKALDAGNVALAATLSFRAWNLDPESVVVGTECLDALVSSGSYVEAARMRRNMSRLAPRALRTAVAQATASVDATLRREADALATSAAAHLATGDLESARSRAASAILIVPTVASAWQTLAEYALRKGDHNAAVEVLDCACRIEALDRRALASDPRWAKLRARPAFRALVQDGAER